MGDGFVYFSFVCFECANNKLFFCLNFELIKIKGQHNFHLMEFQHFDVDFG